MSVKILILGSTGLLGSKLLKLLDSKNIIVNTATCYRNNKKLIYQKDKYKIRNIFTLSNENEKAKFLKLLKSNFDIIYFLDFGSSSLVYLHQFLKYNINSTIAIANKEMIIAGGKYLFKRIKSSKNFFVPLDSEHFSLKNSLIDKNVRKVYLTASGGPFFFSKKSSLVNSKISDVIKHPKWKMGVNNSIDSSNFMNKLLEIFELSYIYDISLEKIDFIISKEAFVHSIIEYEDGILSLNSFKNDMLLTLVFPLRRFFKNIPFFNSKNSLMNFKNFRLDNHYDKRFNFFKFYRKFKSLNHSDQIKLMILNNKAQYLYLSNQIKYQEILPYINRNLKYRSKLGSFNSLLSIVKYINKLKVTYSYD